MGYPPQEVREPTGQPLAASRPPCPLRVSYGAEIPRRNRDRLSPLDRKASPLLDGGDNNDFRDRSVLGLNHRGVRRHLHLLRYCADLQGDMDLNVVAYLQQDARLDITLESRPGHLERTRTDRQVGEHVSDSNGLTPS